MLISKACFGRAVFIVEILIIWWVSPDICCRIYSDRGTRCQDQIWMGCQNSYALYIISDADSGNDSVREEPMSVEH